MNTIPTTYRYDANIVDFADLGPISHVLAFIESRAGSPEADAILGNLTNALLNLLWWLTATDGE